MARDSAYAIDPGELLQAYTLGYFPMAQHREDAHAVWVLPDDRGVLPLEDARAPKKLLRLLKREPFEVRINTCFSDVIAACAAAAPGRRETWINDAIIDVYTILHELGVVHTVECFRDGRLVGGLYGVALGGVFCGESMFSREDNASKIALLYLIARLKIGGFAVLDTQFFSAHLAQFGVKEMPNADYQTLLAAHLNDPADFLKAGPYLSAGTVLQSITQTS